MDFGVTASGFRRKRLADIKIDIENTLRATLGNQINLLPESVFGQIVGIQSERESELWEALEAVFNSFNPNAATGVALDNLVALIGLTRNAETPSLIEGALLFGTAGSAIPSGTQFSVSGMPNSSFVTTSPVTLSAGQNEEQLISFSSIPTSGTFRLNYRSQDTQDLSFNSSAMEVQEALSTLDFGDGIEVSGDFSNGFTVSFLGDAGLQEQPLILIDDNQLVNSGNPIDINTSVVVEGANQASVNLFSNNSGPIIANAGTLTNIDTPVTGLTRVINTSDAIPGNLLETDNELRLRRASSLQSSGAATPEAIRSVIMTIPGVTSAIVFENETNIVDLNGRPPKSYEVLVSGGDQQAIFDTVFQTKPAGIETFGNLTGQVLDSQGQSQVVRFSRPNEIEIFVEIDVTVNPVLFPPNGLATIEQLVVNRGNLFGVGGDVILSPSLICSVDSIPGILSITIRAGRENNPTESSNIFISDTEVSIFDTSRTTARIV